MKKAEDLVVDSRLWLPSPASFNDPYEFQAQVVLEQDAVKRRHHFRKVGKRVGLKGRELEARLGVLMKKSNADPHSMDKVLEQTRERFGIACFSLNPKALRMWSLYAEGHSGICLQFNVANDLGFAVKTMSVNYQRDIATIHWPAEQDRIVEDVLLRKWDIWREEEEVRYVSKVVVNSHLPLSPAFLSAIILGNRFPDSNMPALNEYLRRRNYRGLPRVKLYRADRYRDRYGMFIRGLNNDEMKLLPSANKKGSENISV